MQSTVVLKSLFTKEDPYHIHKTLGGLCLLSFLWRFSFLLSNVDDADLGFASHPALTLQTVLLHLSLTLSAFVFGIPPRRIDSGFRIWPEYRWHSLVFLCRSLALILWQQHVKHLYPSLDHWVHLAIVIGTNALADLGTYYWYKHQKSGFARQLQAPPLLRFYFSVAQFQATSACLYSSPSLQCCALYFVFAAIIQTNAFLMTLRRKNLADHRLLVTCYGVLLLTGWRVGHVALVQGQGIGAPFMIHLGACLAVTLRLAPKGIPNVMQSKYVIWPIVSVLMQLGQPRLQEWINKDSTSYAWMLGVGILGSLPVFGLGIYKSRQKSPKPLKDKAGSTGAKVKRV